MDSGLRNAVNLRNWSLFEGLWLAVFVGAGTAVSLSTKDSLLNYAVLVTGILCVVLAAKGNIWSYAFGLVNSFGYAYVSYANGLYGDMGLNLLFFVPTNVIGFFLWKRHLGAATVDMRGLRLGQLGVVLLVCALAIGGLGFALSRIATQNTPYIDATATVLSIAATLLMLGRYKEQWLLYIALNMVTIAMWAIRLARGSADGSIMVLLWTAYLANAVYGYALWRKGAAGTSAAEAAR